MDSQQSREWQVFEQHAQETLRNGYRNAGKVIRLVQVLSLPSVAPAVSWEVFKRKSTAPDYFAVQQRWRRDKDFDRLMAAVRQGIGSNQIAPTFETETVSLQPAFIEPIITKLATVQVPVWIEDTPLGLDGTSTEVVFGNFFYRTQYRWWENPPDNWKPLVAIVGELVATLDGSVTT
jgi:hypothetical protein